MYGRGGQATSEAAAVPLRLRAVARITVALMQTGDVEHRPGAVSGPADYFAGGNDGRQQTPEHRRSSPW